MTSPTTAPATASTRTHKGNPLPDSCISVRNVSNPSGTFPDPNKINDPFIKTCSNIAGKIDPDRTAK